MEAGMTEPNTNDTAHFKGGDVRSDRAAETGHPSDMAGGDASQPSGLDQAGGRYAGKPGPAGTRGKNHIDEVREE
jgi:hypothetical protein